MWRPGGSSRRLKCRLQEPHDMVHPGPDSCGNGSFSSCLMDGTYSQMRHKVLLADRSLLAGWYLRRLCSRCAGRNHKKVSRELKVLCVKRYRI